MAEESDCATCTTFAQHFGPIEDNQTIALTLSAQVG
jgi:hypothetical protein